MDVDERRLLGGQGRIGHVGSGLSIIMPVYNEHATVQAAIADALAADLPVERRELIVVDDGSNDGTRELLLGREWPEEVTVLCQDQNRGKGAAIRTGLQRATCEFSAILDADLEYHASDLAAMLEPLLSGEANVIFGRRLWTSQTSYSFWYVIGNRAVTFATNLLFNCWISDVMIGHKAMRTDLFRSLALRERGFGIEPEIAARVMRTGERIFEIPISYRARTREEGKKLTAVDGLRVLRTLIRCRIR
jgi:glycosyltransferase involved in cell wall biosynthesis